MKTSHVSVALCAGFAIVSALGCGSGVDESTPNGAYAAPANEIEQDEALALEEGSSQSPDESVQTAESAETEQVDESTQDTVRRMMWRRPIGWRQIRPWAPHRHVIHPGFYRRYRRW